MLTRSTCARILAAGLASLLIGVLVACQQSAAPAGMAGATARELGQGMLVRGLVSDFAADEQARELWLAVEGASPGERRVIGEMVCRELARLSPAEKQRFGDFSSWRISVSNARRSPTSMCVVPPT